MFPVTPIKVVGPPNKDGCCIPVVPCNGGAFIKFGMEVRDSEPPPLPNPPSKSTRAEFLVSLVLLLLLLVVAPKRSNSPGVSFGDGGAGIPLPNRFWSIFVVFLSQVFPPKADVKSAKSPSSVLELLTAFPKPKFPLEADFLLGAILR